MVAEMRMVGVHGCRGGAADGNDDGGCRLLWQVGRGGGDEGGRGWRWQWSVSLGNGSSSGLTASRAEPQLQHPVAEAVMEACDVAAILYDCLKGD
nr:hypothetical protein [Tanacetum cinerariifolium]